MKCFIESLLRRARLWCRALPTGTRPLSSARVVLVAALLLLVMSVTAPAAVLGLTAGEMPILTGASPETFTGNVSLTGTLTVRVGAVEYLVVGGGGGGGNAATQNNAKGGQGGQVLNDVVNLTDNSDKAVTVGAGGARGPNQNNAGLAGGSSSKGYPVYSGYSGG